MRQRDELKQDAIFKATVKLVNETGFAAGSVSKIAREAGVSPATIYIYYKNKDDLLVSTYVNIKMKLSQAILRNFDEKLPVRDILKSFWFEMFEFILLHPDYIKFTEQFSNSPYYQMVNKEEVEKYFKPVISVLKNGIEMKIIKDVSFDVLSAFIFHPILNLSNERLCGGFQKSKENIETAFTLAWDAIKL